MEAVQGEKREFQLKAKDLLLFTSLIKSGLAPTSRDSVKFRQLLGERGQAGLVQHDLLHQGVEQGEAPVPPPQLGELRRVETPE